MSSPLHLDTHVVVWLYAEQHDRFPAPLRARLEREPLRISPVVRLELAYLHEIGRVTDGPAQIIGELVSALGLAEAEQSLAHVVDKAIHPIGGEPWFTRDPFDRIIVATAIAAKARLVTKDEVLRRHLPQHTVWD